jgi:Fur family ferric uptake transcriptional regulator
MGWQQGGLMARSTPEKPAGSALPASADDAVKLLLRTDGGRVTMARMLVLRVLSEAGHHLGVQEIYARVNALAPPINLSTVYRTVTRLEALGLIHTIPTQGESQYGVVQEPHHHAICTGCGRVTELAGPSVAAALRALEVASGYALAENSSLTVRGLCNNCQNKPAANRGTEEERDR